MNSVHALISLPRVYRLNLVEIFLVNKKDFIVHTFRSTKDNGTYCEAQKTKTFTITSNVHANFLQMLRWRYSILKSLISHIPGLKIKKN